MKLNENAFLNIKNGIKKFELRLNDEKRQKLSLNDNIKFHNLNNIDEIISVKIIGLLRYNSFKDLFIDIDYNLCGPANSLEEKLERVHIFYTTEEEQKYGILAIKIELI
ncbi:MAG: ASCH domain-containing protein [Bacteroidales bacterium]|nr:ASCH domain-containing protein [Bacteroidales bacterium]